MGDVIHLTFPSGQRATVRMDGDLTLDAFPAAQRNDILRACTAEMANHWRTVYLPLRFSDYVRRAPWSYRVTPKYAMHKDATRRGTTPLVYTGDTRDAALGRSYVESRAAGGRARAIVRLPLPPYAFANAKVSRIIRTISNGEAERLTTVFRETLRGYLNGARAIVQAGQPLRAALPAPIRTTARQWVRPQALQALRTQADRLAGRRGAA